MAEFGKQVKLHVDNAFSAQSAKWTKEICAVIEAKSAAVPAPVDNSALIEKLIAEIQEVRVENKGLSLQINSLSEQIEELKKMERPAPQPRAASTAAKKPREKKSAEKKTDAVADTTSVTDPVKTDSAASTARKFPASVTTYFSWRAANDGEFKKKYVTPEFEVAASATTLVKKKTGSSKDLAIAQFAFRKIKAENPAQLAEITEDFNRDKNKPDEKGEELTTEAHSGDEEAA